MARWEDEGDDEGDEFGEPVEERMEVGEFEVDGEEEGGDSIAFG